MSHRLTHPENPHSSLGPAGLGAPIGALGWDENLAPPEPEGIQWGRYLDAVKRHTVLILSLVALGSAAGFYLTKRVKPVYTVQATVWINATNNQQNGGPIRSQQLLQQTSWVDLLRSFAIVDSVVRRLNLNVAAREPADGPLFRDFVSGPFVNSGRYVLRVDRNGREYVLSTLDGVSIEHGLVGDSIGRRLGFRWSPEARLFRPGRVIPFSISTPRSASLSLLGRMHSTLPEDGQFLTLALSGSDPKSITRTVNVWAEQFVNSASDLKKRHLLEFKQILGDQLGVAARELQSSEADLERFRVNNITLPSGASPLASSQTTNDPLVANYFQQKGSLDDVRADREALERMMAESKGGPLNAQAFLRVPSILNNTPQLRTAIDELSTRQATLRTEQQYLTDANPRIKQLSDAVHVLEYTTIPQIAQSVLISLRARERELGTRIDTQSQQLRGIPTRTFEEMRLARQVSASENLYNSLKGRYEEVSLADAETSPDLTVLDSAVVPTHPSSNEAPRMLLLAVLASIGVAIGLALLIDRLDRRFRYPEEATRELGLAIAGTVPQFKANRRGDLDLDTMSQAIESFRTLRLAVRYEFPSGEPVVLSVSSPSAGDGKSLVASNLALAFAGAGHRTLLIDGDVRCGTQHETFNVPPGPGLVDYLQNLATNSQVLKATSSDNLFIVPCGNRCHRAPELLVSERMNNFVLAARSQFDVVIIDSPPFVAGVDAYALAAVAGSLLIVLRQAVTDRKLAAAKLQIVDRLPIRVLGSVLNSVPDTGAYRYYGNEYYSYGTKPTKEELGNIATPKGLVLRA